MGVEFWFCKVRRGSGPGVCKNVNELKWKWCTLGSG